jgi:hypothetical protein
VAFAAEMTTSIFDLDDPADVRRLADLHADPSFRAGLTALIWEDVAPKAATGPDTTAGPDGGSAAAAAVAAQAFVPSRPQSTTAAAPTSPAPGRRDHRPPRRNTGLPCAGCAFLPQFSALAAQPSDLGVLVCHRQPGIIRSWTGRPLFLLADPVPQRLVTQPSSRATSFTGRPEWTNATASRRNSSVYFDDAPATTPLSAGLKIQSQGVHTSGEVQPLLRPRHRQGVDSGGREAGHGQLFPTNTYTARAVVESRGCSR